ncbi:hypothetical protein OHB41_33095 [Streptomyces sp. NBC_01571]|uniref:hypothetical protein n=1 Tax=Streptomyces sp. NBC_01571 TaxID=2975883 RepID=UPI002258A87B|nr:hypothetical protein [Streptomyces sp. NBC_01571]MCX4577938.1 hypothetical protein [Streptomyces sp. NBC_01571]
MAENYQVFADYDVLTADEVNNYLMNQVTVKVDTSTDLNALPTEVKQAYVVDTGQVMARDNTDAWVPLGGVATVSTTAPSNPQVGQLWVMPSQALPAPGTGVFATSTLDVTALNGAYAAWGSTASWTNNSGRAVKALITWGGTARIETSSSGIRARLNWTGATTGDTYALTGSVGRSLFLDSTSTYESWERSAVVTLNSGTTTFQIHAAMDATSTPTNKPGIGNAGMQVSPLGFADQWAG